MNLYLGILEFLGINLEFLELILEFLGKILEFLRINLEFLSKKLPCKKNKKIANFYIFKLEFLKRILKLRFYFTKAKNINETKNWRFSIIY